MKKLILNKAIFEDVEVLSRSQLKNIMGGLGSESSNCDSLPSIVYCRDASYNILNGEGTNATGCSTDIIQKTCGNDPNVSFMTSTCTCIKPH